MAGRSARSLRPKCPAQFVGVVCADCFAPSRSASESWPLARLEIRRETHNQNFPLSSRAAASLLSRRHRALKTSANRQVWIAPRHSSVVRRATARDVAKGTPGRTFANRLWRAGAGVAAALSRRRQHKRRRPRAVTIIRQEKTVNICAPVIIEPREHPCGLPPFTDGQKFTVTVAPGKTAG
jgi:hypothetical protein